MPRTPGGGPQARKGAQPMAPRKQDIVVEDGAVYVLRAGTPVYVKTADICSATGNSNQ